MIDVVIIESDFSTIPTRMFERAYEESEVEFLENHYISEKTHKSLGEKFRDVIAAIVEAFRALTADIKNKIEEKSRSKFFKDKLKNDIERIKRMKAQGVEYVTISDMDTYQKTYKELNAKLHKYAEKFMKIKYSNTAQIDEDFEKFDKIIEDYQVIIDDASKKSIRIPIDQAMKLRSDELTGKTKYVEDLINEMNKFVKYEEAAKHLKTIYGIKGDDVIPKHQNFIIKILNRISAFIKKAIVKAITTVAFVIG